MKVPIKLLLFFLVIAAVLLLTELYQRNRQVSEVRIHIHNANQNSQDTAHFLSENQLLQFINKDGTQPINELKVSQIDTKKIENLILSNSFVSACEASINAKANLKIDVEEQKPLARILPSNPSKGAYITVSGKLAPLSLSFTARVLLLSSDYITKMQLLDSAFWKSEEGSRYIEALSEINKHKFWRAQLSQIDISKTGNWIAYPQVGNQEIELGEPINMKRKLARLSQFYKQVVPKKGWGNYKFISVRYDNQIVCK